MHNILPTCTIIALWQVRIFINFLSDKAISYLVSRPLFTFECFRSFRHLLQFLRIMTGNTIHPRWRDEQ